MQQTPSVDTMDSRKRKETASIGPAKHRRRSGQPLDRSAAFPFGNPSGPLSDLRPSVHRQSAPDSQHASVTQRQGPTQQQAGVDQSQQPIDTLGQTSVLTAEKASGQAFAREDRTKRQNGLMVEAIKFFDFYKKLRPEKANRIDELTPDEVFIDVFNFFKRDESLSVGGRKGMLLAALTYYRNERIPFVDPNVEDDVLDLIRVYDDDDRKRMLRDEPKSAPFTTRDTRHIINETRARWGLSTCCLRFNGFPQVVTTHFCRF
jgi:hypothetical protein